MDLNLPVSEIMRKNVVTINESSVYPEICKVLNKEKVQHLPVVKQDKVIGMISSCDLLRLNSKNMFDQIDFESKAILEQLLNAGYFMTKEVPCLKAHESVEKAANIFVKNDYHSLPVINDSDMVVGIVSPSDILFHIMNKNQ